MPREDQSYDAWNPGLTSEIPTRLLPLVTLFRPENGTVSYQDAKEAASFCGLKPADMAAFTLKRLIIHELLIRVTADLSVPDGPNYEELGINLRGMVARIFDTHVTPQLGELQTTFDDLKRQGETLIRSELDTCIFNRPAPQAPPKGLLSRLLGKSEPATPTRAPESLALDEWQTQLDGQTDPARKAALTALISIVGGITATRGRLMADADIVTRLALNMYLNTYGSRQIGEATQPIIRDAVKAEGYRFLPPQTKPFFMNVKGASASGKSTIRPQQRALAEQLDVPWEDFALVSPDYWRKYLLDYDTLGEDYKYAAMLTGQELEIIDKKLDTYMTAKAARQAIPHLLIDRFRFDSFSTDAQGNLNTRLLTRFGDTVFLFFLVTPPAATVERAYKRGLETGRFKAVDDLLYHNIEAYTGMPELFFSWVAAQDKKIHFEFLDNSVKLGERPRTIAYGWNDAMTVLDMEGLHNIDRFRAVNVEATTPSEVLQPAPDLTFLSRCIAKIETVTFVNPKSRTIYGATKAGEWVNRSPKTAPASAKEWLDQQGWTDCQESKADQMSAASYALDQSLTLGVWGEEETPKTP